MSVYRSKYLCNSALVKNENSLPQFRDRKTNFNVINSKSVPKEYSNLLGFECGKRIYPYKKQDGYNRNCKKSEIDSIILENDYLRATFLPSLGARLISLYDKTGKKELLFSNKNIQMCNLAIRDAWFSGGIEWNIGQYGHSLTTSDDVFVSVQNDDNNNEFIRIYEFERMHEIYWHIDFHLPRDSKFLFAKAYIHNLNDYDTSLYCWTNTALRKTEFTRVFSNTKNALFLNPFLKDNMKGYDYIELPNVDKLPNLDISYPKRFPYSNEYFFTSNNCEIPYEVTVEENGECFFDFSTSSLPYRKMFCWGEQPGGIHWQSYLSPSTSGEYFEAQAGVAPSQLHGAILKKNSAYTFTQVFGAYKFDKNEVHNKDYDKAFKYVQKALYDYIDELNIDLYDLDKAFEKYSTIKPNEILHCGSGFGYLNLLKNDYNLPSAYKFERNNIKNDELLYLDLLENNNFDFDYVISDFQYPPLSYKSLLNKINTEGAKYLDAVLEIELLNYEIALKKLIDLDKTNSNCLICRNIAQIYWFSGKVNLAIKWYEKALSLSTDNLYINICEEFSRLLIDNEKYEMEKTFLESIDKNIFNNSDNLLLDLAIISSKFSDLETLENCLYNREYANIREGANPFEPLFYEYKALEYAKNNNIEVTDLLRKKMINEIKLPIEFDFTVLLK